MKVELTTSQKVKFTREGDEGNQYFIFETDDKDTINCFIETDDGTVCYLEFYRR